MAGAKDWILVLGWSTALIACLLFVFDALFFGEETSQQTLDALNAATEQHPELIGRTVFLKCALVKMTETEMEKETIAPLAGRDLDEHHLILLDILNDNGGNMKEETLTTYAARRGIWKGAGVGGKVTALVFEGLVTRNKDRVILTPLGKETMNPWSGFLPDLETQNGDRRR